MTDARTQSREALLILGDQMLLGMRTVGHLQGVISNRVSPGVGLFYWAEGKTEARVCCSVLPRALGVERQDGVVLHG